MILEYIGSCASEETINEIFGSVSEFARLVEIHGDGFVFGNVMVKYNPVKDIHTFWKIDTK